MKIKNGEKEFLDVMRKLDLPGGPGEGDAGPQALAYVNPLDKPRKLSPTTLSSPTQEPETKAPTKSLFTQQAGSLTLDKLVLKASLQKNQEFQNIELFIKNHEQKEELTKQANKALEYVAALWKSEPGIIKLLMDAGADPEHVGISKRTPLEICQTRKCLTETDRQIVSQLTRALQQAIEHKRTVKALPENSNSQQSPSSVDHKDLSILVLTK